MDLQTHLKAILKNRYHKLNDILLPINVSFPNTEDLNHYYTKHYNRHIDLSHFNSVEENATFPFEDLLKCDCKHSRDQKTIVTLGAFGIGKTTAVQRCALDWAEGRAYKDIDLLFILSCWELSLLENEELSLIQLLQMFYPDLKELSASSLSSKKVWFVFDELEDLNGVLYFSCPEVCDVTQVTPVHTLLPNLIKGNLLPNAHIWITTRYSAAEFIWDCYKLKETEMRGFNDEQKELHIRSLVGDADLANRIIDHIKMSRSLYYLCRIPYMCTVMATVLKRHVKTDDYKIRPMTLTQIYSSLTEEAQSDIFPKLKDVVFGDQEDMSRCFCWIHEEELKENDEITVSTLSSFAREHPLVFREEKSVRGVSIFRFAHVSVIEYFVTLVKFTDVTTHHSSDQHSLCFYKVVDDAERQYHGQLDICLRFFFGLLKERGTLQPSDPFFAYIKKKIVNDYVDDTKVMLFHCLREFDSQALLDDIMSYYNMGCLAQSDGAYQHWAEVMLMIMNVEGKRDKFEMELSSRCDEKVLRSLPALLKSRKAMLRFSDLSDSCCPALASVLGTKESHLRELDLGFNSITDTGVQSLVQGLKEQDCRLKSLRLQGCELTSSACEHLATALKQSPQLKELDLSCNDIGDMGLQRLASGLESPNCQLETLKLSQCNFKKKGGFHLASALEKNPSYLKWLDLSINNIGNKAANELFSKFDISRLTKLEMYYCGLTEQCCAKLAEALKHEDGKLVELNLSSNYLNDGGAYWIRDGLFAWSRLEKLNLSRCGITALGCFYLSKVLSCISALYSDDMRMKIGWQATELRELNLSMNKFADSGAINISSGFRNPYSHLQKLNLSECSLTYECCSALATQLSSSECPITELDLSSNIIQDMGVRKLCVALKRPMCALRKLYLRNCGLSSNCVAFLVTALKTNLHLTDLFLMGNKLDDRAIEVLVGITKNDAYRLHSVDVSLD